MIFFQKPVDNGEKVWYNRFRHRKNAFGSIAQLGEHLPYKQRVIGSSPVVPTRCIVPIGAVYYGSVVQLVRMPPCHGGGQGFESPSSRHVEPTVAVSLRQSVRFYAFVAQLVEQGTENPCVVGSILTEGTKPAIRNRKGFLWRGFITPAPVRHRRGGQDEKRKSHRADLAHLVERDLAKVEVAGSSPVIRSKTRDKGCHSKLRFRYLFFFGAIAKR